MLVLTRRVGERIIIGNDIEIVILPNAGEQVRIGINAPRSVPIHRAEVFDRLAEANRSASGADDTAGLPTAPTA